MVIPLSRLLIISDVHGNYEALKTVLENAGRYDQVIVLGDLVDYGPDPDLVIDEVRSIGALVLRGNHDEAVAKGIDCGCGERMHPISVYTRRRISMTKLSKTDVAWLDTLPYEKLLQFGNTKIKAVHAAPKNRLYAYLYPWLSNEEVKELLDREPNPIYLIGHTHYQFLRPLEKGVKIINPGSVGQPRDGDPRAAYAIMDLDSGNITFGRIEYDRDRVAMKLKDIIDRKDYLEVLLRLLHHGSL